MKLYYVTILAALLLLGASADNLKWATGKPLYISTTGPYIVYVEVQADSGRTFVAELRDDVTNNLVASTSVQIAGGFDGKQSIPLEFDEVLVVDRTYTVVCDLVDGNTIVSTTRAVHTAVDASLHFEIDFDTVPAQMGTFNLEVTYTTRKQSYFVVAVKDPTDTNYLGSARVYCEPGLNVQAIIPVRVANSGATLPIGQLAIVRVDLRPADTAAKERFDRVEKLVTASDHSPEVPEHYSLTLLAPQPATVTTCAPIVQEISYQAAGGPNYIYLRLHDSTGKKVKQKRIANVPSGVGKIVAKIRPTSNNITVGETYQLRVDIRPMSAHRWADREAEVRSSMIPAESC